MGSTQGHRAHPHVFGKTDWSNKATRGFTSTRPTKSLCGLCMKSRPILVTRNPWPLPQQPPRYPTCRHHNHRRRCHLCACLPASVVAATLVAATVVATTLSAKVCAFCPPNHWSTCSTSVQSWRIPHREPPHSTHMSGPHASIPSLSFPRRSGMNRRSSMNSPSPHVARGKGCASGWSSCLLMQDNG